MAIFGISDLHLALGVNKPMDVFGSVWQNHHEQIRTHWLERITDNDIVLIPGDISWAMTLEEFQPDLEYLNSLPGKKIYLRGNHDYWWGSLKKVRTMFGESSYAIQNDSVPLEDGIVLAGTRGWICPNDREFTEHDRKIYDREVHRLKLSLEHASTYDPKEIWVMTHYMPVNDKHEQNDMIDVLKEYNVTTVLYGHLHSYGHDIKIEGTHWDMEFHLISCDYLRFAPKLLYPMK